MEKINLVIVESPAKATTIAKYLNSNKNLASYGKFIVLSSKGHVRDLKKKELSIDVDNNFTPIYDVLEDKKALVTSLREQAKKATMVYLATDYDREGEGISMHLRDVLNLKKYKRITFTEITSKALEDAVKNPRDIDEDLVDAQETRRILDRLVGFKLSPLLWKKYSMVGNAGLSAGRVQSAVMHMILERENEIESFDTGCYWYFLGNFNLMMGTEGKKNVIEKMTDVKLYDDKGMVRMNDGVKAKAFLEKLKDKFSISEIKSKISKQSPDPPFITSSLQQEAYTKHSFGIKRTMQLAQELYENGHITYMRTDSYNLSDDFKKSAEAFVNDRYGESYWDGGASAKKRKSKNSQEAHEAIRPTDPHLTDLPAGGKYTPDHRKLYEMIWKRTIASLLKQAIFDELILNIVDKSMTNDAKMFVASIKKVKYNGYLIVYGQKNEAYDFQKFQDSIRGIECENILAKNTWSNPPARYNDSSIIKVLEAEGIGRPSTYAAILTKLMEKNYVIKTDVAGIAKPTVSYLYAGKKITQEKGEVVIGSEKTRLVPTNIGKEIDTYLSDRFPYIVDKRFTSSMEGDLDQIAVGDKTKDSVLNMFWTTFGKDVKAETSIKQTKQKIEAASNSFKIDGKQVNVRIARYGPVVEIIEETEKSFIALKNYLKYVRKDYLDIDETDVKFLMRFPISVKGTNDEKATLEMGPYGLYIKSSSGNHRMPLRMIMNVINARGKIDPSEVTSVINYKKDHEKSKEKDGDKTKSKAKPKDGKKDAPVKKGRKLKV